MHAIYQAILKMVHEINETWIHHVIYAEIYPLPLLEKAHIPDKIIPSLLIGEDAVQTTLQALSQFNWLKQQHPATVMRLPVSGVS